MTTAALTESPANPTRATRDRARRWVTSGPRRRALLPRLALAFSLPGLTAVLVNDPSANALWFLPCALVTVHAAFMAGRQRTRVGRGVLTELLRGLGTTHGGGLQAMLARTLGDPALLIAYWQPEYRSFVDADGQHVELPPRGRERAFAPVERDGRRVAALLYDASLDDDPELVDAVRAATAIAIENERLRADSLARLAELQASRERIVAAGDAERRRLERNLHDGAQQRLLGVALQLRLLKNRVSDDASINEIVTTVIEELAESMSELRELARGIHPAVLARGLAPALDALASRSAVVTTVSVETSERLPENVELAAYFVASEALANVAKHAHATQATVNVSRTGSLATVAITDDGVGGADDARGSGLRGLADRVEALNGHLQVTSPPGRGTTVIAEIPCAS